MMEIILQKIADGSLKSYRITTREPMLLLNTTGSPHTIMEWSRILDIPYSMLQSRHKLGWDAKQIIETPKHKHRLKESK